MNKTGIIIISLAILGSGLFYVKQLSEQSSNPLGSNQENTDQFSGWKKFKARSGLFEVMLPTKPQYAKDLVSVPYSDEKRRYDMYASEKIDGTLFLISVITYPKGTESDETVDILKQTVEELMKSKPDNQLTKIENSLFHQHPSMDFSIENRSYHVEGRVFMPQNQVFVLSYVTKQDHFDKNEFQYFVKSFHFLVHDQSNEPLDNGE